MSLLGGVMLIITLVYAATAWSPTTYPLPEVTLENADGQDISLRELVAGRPAIINAWASWCPFCAHELPDFVALQKEFGDAVVIVAINRNEPKESAQAYVHSIGAEGELIYLFDSKDAWYQKTGGYVMPETIFVDAHGMVQKHKRGPLSLEEMEHYTALLLAGEPLDPDRATAIPEEIVGCTDGKSCHL